MRCRETNGHGTKGTGNIKGDLNTDNIPPPSLLPSFPVCFSLHLHTTTFESNLVSKIKSSLRDFIFIAPSQTALGPGPLGLVSRLSSVRKRFQRFFIRSPVHMQLCVPMVALLQQTLYLICGRHNGNNSREVKVFFAFGLLLRMPYG